MYTQISKHELINVKDCLISWKYNIPKVDNTSGIGKYCIVLYYRQASCKQAIELTDYNQLNP